MGTGLTFAFAAMANLIVEAVPRSEVGIATGINTVMRTVGGSFGAAIVTAILTAGTGLPTEHAYTTAFALLGGRRPAGADRHAADPAPGRAPRADAAGHGIDGTRHLHVRGAHRPEPHGAAAAREPARGDRAGRRGRARRVRRGRAPPARVHRLRARGRAGRGGGANVEDPADVRGLRAELRRPRARLPGLRDARPDLRRARRDHGRPRLVHRVLPALRLRPRRLPRALRRAPGPAAAHPRVDARDLAGPPPRADRGPRRLPAPRPGPAAGVDRGRRHAGVGRARRVARAADGAGDHRRPAVALRAVRRAAPPRRRAGRPPAPEALDQLPRVHRRHDAAGAGRGVPGAQDGDGQDRPRARLGADEPRAVRRRARRSTAPT